MAVATNRFGSKIFTAICEPSSVINGHRTKISGSGAVFERMSNVNIWNEEVVHFSLLCMKSLLAFDFWVLTSRFVATPAPNAQGISSLSETAAIAIGNRMPAETTMGQSAAVIFHPFLRDRDVRRSQMHL